jgi:hypothetical protein
VTEVSHYACVLPRFQRSLVIEKGRDGRYAVAISRNGRVLFLSDQPLGELAGQAVVLAIRPWFRSEGGTRRVRGTSILVLTRLPAERPVTTATSVVAASEPPDAFRVVPLSPRGVLALMPGRR